jgi:hypothetical protein
MAHSAAYKRRSPPAIYPSPYLRESGDSKVDSCHMPQLQLSNPRKRLRSEQRLPQGIIATSVEKAEAQPSQGISSTGSILGQLIEDLVD